MVFIKVNGNGSLSVQLELPNTSISFVARDESFMARIIDFISATREHNKDTVLEHHDSETYLSQSLQELDLSDKLSIPIILTKDLEVENHYLLQIKLSEKSLIVHSISLEELEALLIAFKDASIQLEEV